MPWLTDRKWAHIRLEGTGFGDVPINIELKLEVWDSPNSAGIVIDAVRCAKLALDRGIGGTLEGPSSYFMKSPPVQHPDALAHELTEAFISGESNAFVAPEPRQLRGPLRPSPTPCRPRPPRAGGVAPLHSGGVIDASPIAPGGTRLSPRRASSSGTAPSRRSTA